jgi:uncharacterized protein (PEP-CTERM system associated)
MPLLQPTACRAERWVVDAGIESDVTATSNANFGGTTSAADTIIAVRPRIRLLGEGARIQVSGSASLNAVGYARNTQPSDLHPEIDLQGSVQAVERFLFVDASLRASQTNANPFGARPEPGATGENSMTTTAFRLAPRIEGTAPGDIRYQLLSENGWTNDFNAPATATDAVGYFGRHTLSVGHEARPFGWRAEAQHSETRYRDSTLEPLKVDLGRVTLGYLVGEDVTLGVRGGAEHTNFATTGDKQGGSIYGAELRWNPSPRTQLSAWQEHRFFGSSWQLDFKYRTPRFAWSIGSSRQLDTSPQALLDLPPTDNVAALLDAILTTRFPDPIDRARIVNDLITQGHLPSSSLQPITLQAQRLSVVQQTNASVAVLGVRNSLTVSFYRSKTEDAVDSGPLAAGTAVTNNLQYGASVVLAHRLTPQIDLVGSAEWSHIQGLDTFDSERSIQRTLGLRLNTALSRRTFAYAGLRQRSFNANTTGPSDETAAYVGLDHRF